MANIIRNYLNNFKNITKYYFFLINKTKNHEYVEITNEWLIDNYYILAEHKNMIKENMKELKKNLKIIYRNYIVLKTIVSKNNYNLSFKDLINELKSYQKETKKTFTYKELKYIIQTQTQFYLMILILTVIIFV